MNPTKDIVIVGAGLAGLHCALRLAKAFPKKTIAVYEAYKYTGGRVVTYWPKGKGLLGLSQRDAHHQSLSIHWENGAGRIHKSHSMIIKAIQSYNLSLIPISPDSQWRSLTLKETYPNNWTTLSSLLHTQLSALKPSLLQTHTVNELMTQIFGTQATQRILNHFPYRAEMFVMRADVALQTLESEMGSDEDYYVVKEGLSALIDEMVEECEQLGVEFFFGHRCYDVTDDSVHFKVKETGEKKSVSAKKIILALHSKALHSIHPFAHLPLLKKIIMCPLLRQYAVFPTQRGKSWFSDLPKVVTDSPLRYIIPIDPSKGVVMISYTDAQDTQVWNQILEKKGPEALQEAVLRETRKLFPEKKIPSPLFFKAHPWSEGCSYWAPGLYDPAEESVKAMRPLAHTLPNVYVCGESYSMRQCWMEGALEHAEAMLKKYFL